MCLDSPFFVAATASRRHCPLPKSRHTPPNYRLLSLRLGLRCSGESSYPRQTRLNAGRQAPSGNDTEECKNGELSLDSPLFYPLLPRRPRSPATHGSPIFSKPSRSGRRQRTSCCFTAGFWRLTLAPPRRRWFPTASQAELQPSSGDNTPLAPNPTGVANPPAPHSTQSHPAGFS